MAPSSDNQAEATVLVAGMVTGRGLGGERGCGDCPDPSLAWLSAAPQCPFCGIAGECHLCRQLIPLGVGGVDPGPTQQGEGGGLYAVPHRTPTLKLLIYCHSTRCPVTGEHVSLTTIDSSGATLFRGPTHIIIDKLNITQTPHQI